MKTPFLLCVLAAGISLLSHPSRADDEWPEGVEVDRVEGGKIHFKNTASKRVPKSISTPLVDINFVSWLKPGDGGTTAPPYPLFSAKPCNDCPQDRALYLLQATGRKPMQLVYPGKIIDPKTGVTVLDSRAFYGKCLSDKQDVFVVFQREHVDKRRSLQNSVFYAEPLKDKVEERLIERRMPKLDFTLKRVKAKQCFEIEGRKRKQVPKYVDFFQKAKENDDDEEDEAPKENETQSDLPSTAE